jgi:hypothetical protein
MGSFVKLALVAAFCGAATNASAAIVFTAAGAIGPTVDAYRATLGVFNPNVAGSFGAGRREINWDGVPDFLAAPNNLPANFFNVNSPRGAVFNTPGTGFQVSANAAVGPVEFGSINPTYPGLFTTFSPQRLFTALDSNILDVNFFIPGSTDAGLTRGFGAVFTDVDAADTTSIEYFDVGGASLGKFFAPAILGNETLSFLGVDFGAPIVSRVRITSGNAALGPGTFEGALDLVVMDDFIYGEPILGPSTIVPEPAAWALMIGGLGLVGAGLRRRPRSVSS